MQTILDFFSKYISKTLLLIMICFALGGVAYYHFNKVVLTCEAFAKEKTEIYKVVEEGTIEIYKTIKMASAKSRLDTLYLHRSLLKRDRDRYEDLIYSTRDSRLRSKYQGRLQRIEKELQYIENEIRRIK